MPNRRTRRSWLALLTVAMLALPLSGVHWHLCLDGNGSEPPASVHLADDGNHHTDEGDGTHDDIEVKLQNAVLAKKMGGTADIAVFTTTAAVLSLLPLPGPVESPPDTTSPTVSIPAFRTLPPLRAPPV
jgi:hypothetical protein